MDALQYEYIINLHQKIDAPAIAFEYRKNLIVGENIGTQVLATYIL